MSSLKGTLFFCMLSVLLTLTITGIFTLKLNQELTELRRQIATSSIISHQSFDLIILTYDYTHSASLRAEKQWNHTQQDLINYVEAHPNSLFTQLKDLIGLSKTQMQNFQRLSNQSRRTSITPVALISTLHLLSNSAQNISEKIQVQLTNKVKEIYFTLTVTAILLFIFLFILMAMVSLRVSYPLRALRLHFQHVGKGDLSKPIFINGFEELVLLGKSADEMRIDLQETTVSKNALLAEIKERMKTEQQNLQLFEQLKNSQNQVISMEKQSTIGTLVGGVAHEINNPIMAMFSYLEYINNHNKNQQINDKLQKLESLLTRVQRIANGLLVFSRKKSSSRKRCHLHDTILRVNHLFQTSINGTAIDYHYQNDLTQLQVAISEDHLEQILLNILINASHAVANVAAPTISLQVKQQGKSCIITITDNGAGIPPDIQFKIFDPFFTTKDVGQGTGLGLSISNTLINNANGEIHVESKMNNYTSFIIELGIENE
ncbi:sensor histidine kinase [Shewanella intestini]|uniref:histidine kinase n=1 Tax=Shewanella intestini TaxID=2017544 RepID=A0ABS5HYW3_9GAMM|nr:MULTISPECIES: ATP-binding protein [Shewanella]MBR9726964.1 GHKL domain-containing protein [Shewanella intestini]MRG34470.1 HAMP domain-containing protein [Shewanella sp. XMDDZSB0408]